MNKLIKSVIAASLGLTLSTGLMAQDKPNADTVLATVNGTKITLGHVITLTQRLPENYSNVPAQTLFDGILDQLIQQTILAETADTSGRNTMLAQENEQRAFKATVAIDQIVEKQLTEEAIKEVYERDYANAEPTPEFNASHILVETEDEAKELVKMLADGADFAELAKEKSTGPSGPNGGELGWFGQGAMVPPFEAAVKTLAKGEISGPVQTDFGWHVLILNDARELPVPTLADTRGAISDGLRGELITKAIEALEGKAEIVRNTAGIDVELIRNSDLLNE